MEKGGNIKAFCFLKAIIRGSFYPTYPNVR